MSAGHLVKKHVATPIMPNVSRRTALMDVSVQKVRQLRYVLFHHFKCILSVPFYHVYAPESMF